MRIFELLKECRDTLEPSPDAEWDAKELVCTAAGIQKSHLARSMQAEVPPENVYRLRDWASRRKKGEPIQYITGISYFMGLPFEVNDRVLIPRQDTETLCEIALQTEKGKSHPHALDLCTGSGVLAVSLAALGGMEADATDLSREALKVASRNAEKNGVKVDFYSGNLWDAVPDGKKYDLITCNPPYLTEKEMGEISREVAFEPPEALYGGEDGLEFYRRLADRAGDFLAPGGCLLMEIGYRQAVSVTELFKNYETQVYQDINGLDRVVRAQALQCKERRCAS